MATFDDVKDVIVDKLGVDEGKVTPEARFVEDLGADSLETVELIMGLEDKFRRSRRNHPHRAGRGRLHRQQPVKRAPWRGFEAGRGG